MRVVRATTALLIGLCAVPILVFLATWGVAELAGCEIMLTRDTTCRAGSIELGWTIDRLVGFGVWGAITAGLAAHAFASWVMVELAAIVLRRPSL